MKFHPPSFTQVFTIAVNAVAMVLAFFALNAVVDFADDRPSMSLAGIFIVLFSMGDCVTGARVLVERWQRGETTRSMVPDVCAWGVHLLLAGSGLLLIAHLVEGRGWIGTVAVALFAYLALHVRERFVGMLQTLWRGGSPQGGAGSSGIAP